MTRPIRGLQCALVLVPFLLLSGCRGERDAGFETPTGAGVVTTVMDSSGVAIVVNEGTWCPARYRVLAHTERRIPSDEGELAVFTVGIAGGRLLGDGRVVVPDGSNQRLEIYGHDGRLASELLRAGSGPVEVAGPFSFRVSAPDTLIVTPTPSGGLVYMEPDFIDSPNALQMALRLTVRDPLPTRRRSAD